MRIAIYGAQGYALGTYKAIKESYPEREVICFVVSKIGYNAKTLAGLQVREIDEFSSCLSEEDKDEIEVIIATPENIQDEIAATLGNYGFNRVKRLDYKYWNDLMKDFHFRKQLFLPLDSMEKGDVMPELTVYMAKHLKDKPLKSTTELPEYMHSLQVGTANCDVRIGEFSDDVGDNISVKNANYCELTGLYWIWKNVLLTESAYSNDVEYVGLAQYRRILTLSEDGLLRIGANDVDVILPFPLLYEPNIEAHHERYLKEADWKAMLKAVDKVHPDYTDRFREVLEQEYLYNYNIILAKKKVLSDYCSWLFPILETLEAISEPRGDERDDRYIGYMAETLETLYFMVNSERLKIAHVGSRMLV